MSEKAKYTHGHHSSVVNSHARRTVQNSAAFLIPHIKPTDHILDLGCGPGSITVGLAKLVPSGSVIGGDSVDDVLTQARARASSDSLTNITFQKLDGNALPFPDATFDVVFCHQVLQHVADPTSILKEMRRVTKKGGIVAAREADYKSFAWYPELEGLELWGTTYQAVHRSSGGNPNAGRYLKAWAQGAGFGLEDVTFSWDVWNYSGNDAVVWGQSWKDRTLHSNFAKSSLDNDIATTEQLGFISKTWDEWSGMEGSFIMIPNGEILCHVR